MALVIVLPTLAAAAPRSEPEPAVQVAVGALPEANRAALGPLQRHVGLQLVSPSPVEVPARDALLAAARRAYVTMEFRRSIAELQTAEGRLIDGQLPSPERVARLADVELFLGACLLLDGDRPGAEERFVLARALAPGLKVDAIFPPEVAQAFASVKRPAPIAVAIAAAPPDARVWLDGVTPPELGKVTPGLHYVLVERGDRKPVGRVVRVSKSSAKLELAAAVPASRAAALSALSAPRVSETEGLGISRIVGAPVWRLSVEGGSLEGRRYAALDPVRPTATVTAPVDDVAALALAICAIDRCDPVVAAASKPAAPPPPLPLWKRTWFWPVVGVGAGIVLGGVITGAAVGTRPRDYDVVVR